MIKLIPLDAIFLCNTKLESGIHLTITSSSKCPHIGTGEGACQVICKREIYSFTTQAPEPRISGLGFIQGTWSILEQHNSPFRFESYLNLFCRWELLVFRSCEACGRLIGYMKIGEICVMSLISLSKAFWSWKRNLMIFSNSWRKLDGMFTI